MKAALWITNGADGPHTYLGISVAGFPNLFTITGPQSPSVLSNMPVSIEQHVDWVTQCIDVMRETGKTSIEATVHAQDQWVAHVNEVVGGTLMTGANSWYMSANIAGKPPAFLPYLEPAGRRRLSEKVRRDRGQRLRGLQPGVEKNVGRVWGDSHAPPVRRVAGVKQ